LIVDFILSRAKDPDKWWGMLNSPMDCIMIGLVPLIGIIFSCHWWSGNNKRKSYSKKILGLVYWRLMMQSRLIQLPRVELFLKLMILDHAFLCRLGFNLRRIKSSQTLPYFHIGKRKQHGSSDRTLDISHRKFSLILINL